MRERLQRRQVSHAELSHDIQLQFAKNPFRTLRSTTTDITRERTFPPKSAIYGCGSVPTRRLGGPSHDTERT
jgi:hypothetical protein